MLWQLWWVWAVAGLALAILEIIVPGYIFLGFAVGATVTGVVMLVGGPFAAWLSGSVSLLALFFAVASLIGWFALRQAFGVRKGQVKIWDRDINEN